MKIVITGSSSGIGRALAAHFLAAGHDVWGLARGPHESSSPAPAGAFRADRCDISKWPDCAAAANRIAAEWPSLDALIAAAGIHGPVGRALEVDPKAWSEAIRTNLDGTYYALRAFAPLLARATRRAKVICFSGGGATRARPNFSAYGAAKTAVVRLVETIAEEERGRPLDINAIAPGAIATRLTDEVIALGRDRAGRTEYESAVRQKAEGTAPLAKAIALVDWLLSPASDGVSGRLLSAPWDAWEKLGAHAASLAPTDVYQLRRILPEERSLDFRS